MKILTPDQARESALYFRPGGNVVRISGSCTFEDMKVLVRLEKDGRIVVSGFCRGEGLMYAQVEHYESLDDFEKTYNVERA